MAALTVGSRWLVVNPTRHDAARGMHVGLVVTVAEVMTDEMNAHVVTGVRLHPLPGQARGTLMWPPHFAHAVEPWGGDDDGAAQG